MSSASIPIPKSRASSTKNTKIPIDRGDLPPVLPERQSVMAPAKGRLPDVVVLLPQVAIGVGRIS
jgi:hypothetical protein